MIHKNSKIKGKDMEWSITSNVKNMGDAFMPVPWLESDSSSSLHSFFNYIPSAGICTHIYSW